MTEKPFKASNGWTVQKSDLSDKVMKVGDVLGAYWQTIGPDTLEALREFFQHERDRQLGRVRWPENPDVVIYRAKAEDGNEAGRCVLVFYETSALTAKVWERWPTTKAAKWYFAEGPGKPERPWEEAETGEVWRLTVDGEEQNALAEKDTGGVWFNTRGIYIRAAYTGVTAGRKLVNADGSQADD